MEKEKITFREWVICLSIVLSGCFLFFVSSPLLEGTVLQEYLESGKGKETVRVFISGAVLRPGEYEIDVGSSLKRALDRAGFRPIADRKALYSKKILLNSCEIIVPEKKKNTGQHKCFIFE